jgi:FMN phosphatase YigB (HAD superfamily)
MLKHLYPQINWNKINYVGFDLDGTLYDESEFISQAYSEISKYLSQETGVPKDIVYSSIFSQWIIHGSSYNMIFDEFLSLNGVDLVKRKKIVKSALLIYRSFDPVIQINPRVKELLNFFSKNYSIFLVTDGNSELQEKKIKSLSLNEWFSQNNIGITSKYNSDLAKPSIDIVGKIELFKEDINPSDVVFFGDRDCDALFARNAGFNFVHVKNMINLKFESTQ